MFRICWFFNVKQKNSFCKVLLSIFCFIVIQQRTKFKCCILTYIPFFVSQLTNLFLFFSFSSFFLHTLRLQGEVDVLLQFKVGEIKFVWSNILAEMKFNFWEVKRADYKEVLLYNVRIDVSSSIWKFFFFW